MLIKMTCMYVVVRICKLLYCIVCMYSVQCTPYTVRGLILVNSNTINLYYIYVTVYFAKVCNERRTLLITVT